jgi:hypothetical protein
LQRQEVELNLFAEIGKTPMLAWLRDWPEAPARKNLLQVIERLTLVRGLGIESDRERRIHRARYAAIAREAQILSAQHFSRLDETRRLATLVIFAREMEVILITSGRNSKTARNSLR